MLVDGARATLDEMASVRAATCLIFDGRDDRAVEAARAGLARGARRGAAREVLGAGTGALGTEGAE